LHIGLLNYVANTCFQSNSGAINIFVKTNRKSETRK